jgi:hypothetical protein
MKGSRGLGSIVCGALAAVAGCATSSPGPFARAETQWTFPRRVTAPPATQTATASGSWQNAGVGGPRVSVSATVSSVASSMRVRASLRVDDNAYVLVGHLGADGVVRVVFPLDPADDGFVRASPTYDVPEFLPGFADAFRYRSLSEPALRALSPARYDSYDGGTGFVFVIASWRPLHFDRFSDGTRWQSFDVADDIYLRDPRPAIEEMAAVLAGEPRDFYTVQFARYATTNFTPYYTPYYAAYYPYFTPIFLGYAAHSTRCFGEVNRFGVAFATFDHTPTLRYGNISRVGSWGAPRVSTFEDSRGCGRTYYSAKRVAVNPAVSVPPRTPFGRPTRGAPPSPAPPRGTPLYPRNAEPRQSTSGATSPEYRRRATVVTDYHETAPRAEPREPPPARARVETREAPPARARVEPREPPPARARAEPQPEVRAVAPREQRTEPRAEQSRTAPPTPPPSSQPIRPRRP